MSSVLCFVCHNSVSDDTNEEIREKYRDVVGMNLCLDSHMCYICCHLLKKLWFFKSICYKRALEYPVLFTEKGTPNLQSTEIQIHVLCPELCMPNNDIQNLQDNYNSNDYVNFDHNDTKTNIYDITTENTELNSVEATTDIINENHDNYDYNDDYVNNDVEDVNEEFIDEEINVNNDFVIENNGNTEEIKLDSEPKKKKSKRTKKKHFEKIILTKEEQKTELEQQRKSKKYTQAEFKCFPCALGFLFKDTYQAHMMRHEESNGEFKCVTCKLRFATQALLRSHVVLHTERYKCTKCGDYFRTRQVQRHAKLCHNKVGESASCHLCGRVFSDSKALQQHLKRFHISKTSNKKYSCNVCGNNFNNPAALRTHMLKHIQRKFSCDQCAAIFTSPYNLTQHKKKHETSTDDKLYYCETCGVGYTTRKSLLAHKRNALVHQNREYICPICNRISPNDKALNYHISSVHTGSKEYGCTSCSARYSNRKSLVRHIRSHTNPTPVKMAVCHLCGNSFKGKNKLNRHLKEVCEKNKLEEELASYYEQNPI